jgi:hypothetical protein
MGLGWGDVVGGAVSRSKQLRQGTDAEGESSAVL